MKILAARCTLAGTICLALFSSLIFFFHLLEKFMFLVLVQFNFGVDPPPAAEDPALKTPCLAVCPTAASRNSIRNVIPAQSQCPQVILPLFFFVHQQTRFVVPC